MNVPRVTPTPIAKNMKARTKNMIPLERLKSPPTEDLNNEVNLCKNSIVQLFISRTRLFKDAYSFRQCGQRAKELFSVLNRNESRQCAQVTWAIPIGGSCRAGLGAKLMIRLQLGLGHAIL